jgi:hypothetical protein
MVRAQHPDLVGQQLPEGLQRGRGITTLAGPADGIARTPGPWWGRR